MLFYPEYLRVPVGVSQMSAPRLVALVLMIRLLSTQPAPKICHVDWLVLCNWIWQVLAQVAAGSPQETITTSIGRGFDTVLMYAVARYSITHAQHFWDSRWLIALTTIVMGSIGIIESFSNYHLYSVFDSYRGWVWVDKPPEQRLGLLRAQASTLHYIYFGMAMMQLMGILWLATSGGKSDWIVKLGLIGCVVGVFSSLSSGPQTALIVFIAIASLERAPQLVKPLIGCLIGTALLLELVSNRHFYSLIDYIALNSQTAWYRTRLMEVGFAHLSEYWLVGIGSNSIGHWAKEIDGRKHVDVVNHFLLIAIYGGLLNIILYAATFVLTMAMSLRPKPRGRLAFASGALIITLSFASMSVSIFGPALLLSYLAVGAMVSLSQLAALDSEDEMEEAIMPHFSD